MNVVCYFRYNNSEAYFKDVIEKVAKVIVFCEQNGYTIKSVITEERSGIASYSELLKAAIKHDDVKGIVVTDVTRLTRDLKTQVEIFRDMHRHNKKPISLDKSCEELYSTLLTGKMNI